MAGFTGPGFPVTAWRMFRSVDLPLWLLILILAFAAVTFASHFLFPSVRWFLRRRAERVVAELNKRLERPIQPFKLARRTDMIQRVIYDREVVEAVQATGDRDRRARGRRLRGGAALRARDRALVQRDGLFRLRHARGASACRASCSTSISPRRGRARWARSPPEATVVFVMNHRSNMDYVLVTYLAASRSALSYAVGEWARVWPLHRLDPLRWAPIFIRRRSRNTLYRRVLARYVQTVDAGRRRPGDVPRGRPQPDAARRASRSLGLSATSSRALPDAGRDMVFVPVAHQLRPRARRPGARRGGAAGRPAVPRLAGRGDAASPRAISGGGSGGGGTASALRPSWFGEPLSLQAMTGELERAPRPRSSPPNCSAASGPRCRCRSCR